MSVDTRPPQRGAPETTISTDARSERGHYALFSGGYDSLVATYKAIEEMRDGPDTVLHIDTNTGIPANRRFVERVCDEMGWPLRVEEAPMTLLEFAKKFRFPGSAAHKWAYIYFKERVLQSLAATYDFKPHFYTGVRRYESTRRMRNVTETTEEMSKWWWHSPITEFTKEDVHEFRRERALPSNSVWETLHRSGECYCGAFANREEELVLLEAHYPDHYEWLMGVERAVQAYWGRVDTFEERWPDAFEHMEDFRQTISPRPDRLELLGVLYPRRHGLIMDMDEEHAVLLGQQDERTWWGHGAMPSHELRALMAEHEPEQMTLCASCFTEEEQ